MPQPRSTECGIDECVTRADDVAWHGHTPSDQAGGPVTLEPVLGVEGQRLGRGQGCCAVKGRRQTNGRENAGEAVAR
jgi:hypothetical protein